MIAIRSPVTTNVDCPIEIGQKCFCAVHDKHLFHISLNEALLIGAANSFVSENNPETIDNVRKSTKNRPFLRISENRKFPEKNKETNQTKKNKKKKKKTTKKKKKTTKKKKKNKQTKQPKQPKIWQLVYLQQYLARYLIFFFFVFFVFFFCFFWFCWLLGLQSFVLCWKLVLNH